MPTISKKGTLMPESPIRKLVPYAEKAKDHYHGVSKFNVDTGEQNKSGSNLPSYTKVFANTLVKHAEKDSKIIGITFLPIQ